MLLNLIKTLFSKENSRTDFSMKRQQAVRRVVGIRSNGSIRLQWGQYYTKSDVNEKFERLSKKRLSRQL
jgi:hypothetical protein